MTVISGPLASAISHAVANHASAAQTVSSANGSSNKFGPATNVTLSAAAQSAVSGSAASSSGSGASSGVGASAGPGIPLSAASDNSDTSLLVILAKDKVIPKVGVAGASLVVDSKGDIDQVKLNQLVNQQQAKAATQNITA